MSILQLLNGNTIKRIISTNNNIIRIFISVLIN